MNLLMPIVLWLDECVLDEKNVCTRCGADWHEPFKPGEKGMCGKGRSKLVGYSFWCPACNAPHPYFTDPDGHPRGAVWGFNGSLEKPSFTPSLLVHGDATTPKCHLYVIDGMIRYEGDCSHGMRGQTVPMVAHPYLDG